MVAGKIKLNSRITWAMHQCQNSKPWRPNVVAGQTLGDGAAHLITVEGNAERLPIALSMRMRTWTHITIASHNQV